MAGTAPTAYRCYQNARRGAGPSVQTTMRYTHVMNRPAISVSSPLDLLVRRAG
jgi:hypothetical protein